MSARDRSPLRRPALIQQWLLLLLLGGVLILLVEIRFEHQGVLGDKWQSWIPVMYLLFLIVTIPLGLVTIRSFGSTLLAFCFAGLIVVGFLGFWFHAKDKPWQRITTIISTDLSQPGKLLPSDDGDSNAPLLAPLSLVGLGLMGVLIALWHSDGIQGTSSHTETER